MSSDTNKESSVPGCTSAVDSDVELNSLNATPFHSPGSRPRLRLQLPEGGEDRGPAASALNLEARGVDNTEGCTLDNAEKLGTKLEAASRAPRSSFLQFSRRTLPTTSLSKIYEKLKVIFPGLDCSWVIKNLDATHIKPAIRGAVAAWVSLILLVIPRTERAMGQVSNCQT